jgi:uncharacterized protein
MQKTIGEAATPAPVQLADRALAPDLSRGAMLLLIALANGAGVAAAAAAPGATVPPDSAERLVTLAMFTLVHARAYPVFAILFGYGLMQFAARQSRLGGFPAARRLLLRRNVVLAALGAVHGIVLYYGDFLGAYGVVGVVATVLLIGRGPRVLRLVLWIWGLSLVGVLVSAVLAAPHLGTTGSSPAMLPTVRIASLAATDYRSAVVARLAEWPRHTLSVLPFIMIVWLGIWARTTGVLENPESHRRLLAAVAAGGLGIAILGGVPLALVAAGWPAAGNELVPRLVYLHQSSGMFAGPGYVALGGLIAAGVRSRRPRAGSMLAATVALGQRSLSAYLLQSVVWLVLLSPYTLHLADRFSRPEMVGLLVAAGTWVVSLAGAAALQSRGRRGPAESVLRQLTYGRS